jgi:DNA-binding transcriptional LysR family regulator
LNRPVNWNQVYCFSKVAACGSIKHAADLLSLSPSTLSEHISQLEKDLALQLFSREHRKLVLTPEGTKLYLRSKEMFEVGERLLGDVSPIPMGQHPISIGLVPSPSISVAYQIIGDYLKDHGPLDMKLFHARYEELEDAISGAKFDFGFSDRIPERKDIEYEKISSAQIRFYVSPALAEMRLTELLERYPLLLCNAEPNTRTLVEQALENSHVAVHRIVTADYPSVLAELCKRGLGVGAFGEAPITTEMEAFRTLRAPREAPKLMDNLYVLWSRSGENRAAIRNLLSHLPQRKIN